MHHPEKHFAPTVKTLLLSQSDFYLPDTKTELYGPQGYNFSSPTPKKFDFTYAATWPLGYTSQCKGWSGFCKNWSFAKQALEVMCGEYNLTGVLIATRGDSFKCDIPASCEGKMTQTKYIPQHEFYKYVRESRFLFLPQIHDASPRVCTQALALDTPLLMNKHIKGGWKYVNKHTGEFFHDMSDFRQNLMNILHRSKTPGHYTPAKWALSHYGNENAGKRLLAFVKKHFSHRVTLPPHTKYLQ